MSRIAMVIFYVGPLPDYSRYFEESLVRNNDIDIEVFLFNDYFAETDLSGKLKKIPLSLEDFNKLISEKLNIPINVNWGYKLSEFRPAFRIIFEDYLKDYDFWGYCDLDIIFGKISSFITPDVLANFDVITASEIQFVGHFIMFRNNEVLANIFRETDDYKKIFSDNENYYNFDESCKRFYGRPFSFEELAETSQPASIYDLVMNSRDKYGLRIYMNSMCREEPPFNLSYENGIFFDFRTQNEFLYFHLVKAKLFYLFYFYMPKMEHLPEKFRIVTAGIIPDSGSYVNRVTWQIQRALFILKYLLTKVWSKLKLEPQKVLPGWERRDLSDSTASSKTTL